MPYTMEDYRRDVVREYLASLTPDELIEEVPIDALLQRLSTDERLKGLNAEEIRAYLEKLEK